MAWLVDEDYEKRCAEIDEEEESFDDAMREIVKVRVTHVCPACGCAVEESENKDGNVRYSCCVCSWFVVVSDL